MEKLQEDMDKLTQQYQELNHTFTTMKKESEDQIQELIQLIQDLTKVVDNKQDRVKVQARFRR